MIVTGSARRMSKPAPAATPDPVVLIRSSAYASLPAPGNRIDPTDSANMPTIQATTGNSAIKTADGAHNFRLLGLYIRGPSTLLQSGIVAIGGGETTLGEFPTDITVDRCIVRGDPTNGGRRGVALDGIRCAVIDSYVYDIKEDGSDSQAIWSYNTPGPLKIVNNYLEGSGENVMFGGNDPSYANSVPSDIEFRRNYLFKPLAWVGSAWDVKNLLEFKNAQRVLVEGCILENNWAANQSGYSLLVTPRNQNNTAPWSVTQDLTIRYNKLLNCEQGFNLSGDDSDFTSERTYRLSIEHNLLEVDDVNGGDGRSHGIIRGPVDVQIINNTWVNLRASGGTAGFHENTVKADRTIWRNNIFTAGLYGIAGSSTNEGDATFSGHFTNHTYSYNLMIDSASPGNYTGTGNQFPSAETDVFTNFATGDYTVKAAYQNDGSDGNDPGADIAELDALTLHTVDGQWGSEPATYTDSTYTNAELPRSYVNTIYETPVGGTEWVCDTAAEFTTALAGCAVGDIITLTSGNTFSGSFTLRNIT